VPALWITLPDCQTGVTGTDPPLTRRGAAVSASDRLPALVAALPMISIPRAAVLLAEQVAAGEERADEDVGDFRVVRHELVELRSCDAVDPAGFGDAVSKCQTGNPITECDCVRSYAAPDPPLREKPAPHHDQLYSLARHSA
jgi:hypothetical protein